MPAKKTLIPGSQAFQFTTDRGTLLELYGELLTWSDSIDTGVAEHRILQRAGALHQDVGAGPKRWEFHCVMTGADVNARWKRLQAAIDESPFGQLVHVRLGLKDAVCKGVEATETPADEIDTIRYSIKFAEDGLRKVATDSPGALASDANSKAASLLAAAPPALRGPAAKISGTVSAYLALVSVSRPPLLGLAGGVRDVRAACAAFDATVLLRGESYHLKAQSSLIAQAVQASYNAVLAGMPPLIEWPVRSTMSLTRLTASLYGGRYSKDMAPLILSVNRIPRPWSIGFGVVLLIPDPAKVRALPSIA